MGGMKNHLPRIMESDPPILRDLYAVHAGSPDMVLKQHLEQVANIISPEGRFDWVWKSAEALTPDQTHPLLLGFAMLIKTPSQNGWDLREFTAKGYTTVRIYLSQQSRHFMAQATHDLPAYAYLAALIRAQVKEADWLARPIPVKKVRLG